ncbi:trypsin-like peptidase domain protein [Striga asiatica]|uniref:Trypsin-like peptidase domain protein n=1 Tax=Striga asiatica TaxID=4170 RepID=A0A5A7P7K0_STRAF|nr:trypsin-like peptidase domain protein [Striga asiatica]
MCEPSISTSFKDRRWREPLWPSDFRKFAIDVNVIGEANDVTSVKDALQGLVTAIIPVAKEDDKLIGRPAEGDMDEVPAMDLKDAHTASFTVEGGGWVIEVVAVMVLHLELVGVVGFGIIGHIVPRVPSCHMFFK